MVYQQSITSRAVRATAHATQRLVVRGFIRLASLALVAAAQLIPADAGRFE